MSAAPTGAISIVGGGASGVILAAHMMKANPNARVTLIEPTSQVGRGLAYGTCLPDHRLNVAANRMSAFGEDPGHFWEWYRARHPLEPDDPGRFLPRMEYAAYLEEVFNEAAASASGQGFLLHRQCECLAISIVGSGLELRLSDGTSIAAQRAVLATGHDTQPASGRDYAFSGTDIPQMDPDAPVVIIGSGLSMIDAWLALVSRGHRGAITSVSRRGLLPLPHGARRNPILLDSADIPFGTELSYFVRWFSDLIDHAHREGGDWRDVIDGIRPFNQRIWQDWPVSARRRFLDHAKVWWDVHRHRLAPDISDMAQKAISEGRLRLIAGRITGTTRHDDDTVSLRVKLRGTHDEIELQPSVALDCTGYIHDPRASPNPLVNSLLASGSARADRLGIGMDVTPDCEIIDADGKISSRLFAVGPPTRGTFFEIEAVPEIRDQCARLTRRLLD